MAQNLILKQIQGQIEKFLSTAPPAMKAMRATTKTVKSPDALFSEEGRELCENHDLRGHKRVRRSSSGCNDDATLDATTLPLSTPSFSPQRREWEEKTKPNASPTSLEMVGTSEPTQPLKDEIAIMTQKVHRLQDEVEHERIEKQRMQLLFQSEIKEYQGRVETLRRQVRHYVQNDQNRQEASNEVMEVFAQEKKVNAEKMQSLEHTVEAFRKKNEQLEDQCSKNEIQGEQFASAKDLLIARLQAQLKASQESVQKKVDSATQIAQSEIRLLKAEIEEARLESQNAKKALQEANEVTEKSEEFKQLRSELQNVLRSERQLKLKVHQMKTCLQENAVLEEKISGLTRRLESSQEKVALLTSEKANQEMAGAGQSEWEDVFRTAFSSKPNMQQLAKASAPLAALQLLKDGQKTGALLVEHRGKLELRIKQMEKEINEWRKVAQQQGTRCSTLDEQVAQLEHKLDVSERHGMFLEKEKSSLLALLDSYGNEVKLDSANAAKMATLAQSLNDAEETISSMKKVQATLCSPKMVSNHKLRIQGLEQSMQEQLVENSKLRKLLDRAEDEILALHQRVGRGEYNPTTTKVLHLKMNPSSQEQSSTLLAASDGLSEEVAKLRDENQELKERLEQQMVASTSSVNVSRTMDPSLELTPHETVDGLKRLNQRLKEVFRDQISRYREAVYLLTGYKIDLKKDTNSNATQLRLRSMYSEYETDDLVFRMASSARKKTRSGNGSVAAGLEEVEEEEEDGKESYRLELLESDLASRLDKKLVVYLTTCHSIPAFLSNLTLHLFEQQTFQG